MKQPGVREAWFKATAALATVSGYEIRTEFSTVGAPSNSDEFRRIPWEGAEVGLTPQVRKPARPRPHNVLHEGEAEGSMTALNSSLVRISSLLVSLGILAGAIAAGPGSQLQGRTLDQAGAAVSGATVQLRSREGAVVAAISHPDGSYSFARLQAGTYLIEVKASGFSRQVQEIEIGAGENKSLDIPLNAAGVDEDVVVTGSLTSQTFDESSKSLTVVDSASVDQRREYSLIEALRPVAGLRVEQLGGPGEFSKIFINGLRIVDTSVQIDGFRVRDASDFQGGISPFLEDMLVTNVDRIEILRGSGSSLYGSNAVGGVINIVPVEGAGTPKADISLDGGSLGTIHERAQVSGGIGLNFGYSLSANRLDVNDGVQGGEIYRNTSVGAHARYNFNSHASVRATFTFSDGFNRLDDSPFPIGPPGNELGYVNGQGPIVGFQQDEPNPDSFRWTRFFSGSVTFSDQVNSFYNFNVGYQSVDTARHFSNTSDRTAIEAALNLTEFPDNSHADGHIDTLNLTNNISTGRKNLITAGVEFERESFTQFDTSIDFFSPPSTDRQSSLAIFGQDQLSLFAGKLQLLAAVRSEGFMLNNPETVPELHNVPIKRALTGDGSIAYRLGPGTKLRSHVGNSFRAPSLSERFQIFQGHLIGDPFLKPERAVSVDAGVDQELFRGKLRLSGTYFYTRLQEVITSTTLFMETNSRGALSRGLNLSVQASPRPGTDLYSSYSFTNSATIIPFDTLLSNNTVLPSGASIQSFSIPRHQFSLGLNQRFLRKWSGNFDLFTISSHVFPLFDPIFFNEVIFRFKGYTRADVGLSFTQPISDTRQMTLYVKVDNFTGARIVDEGFLAPGVTALAGVKFTL